MEGTSHSAAPCRVCRCSGCSFSNLCSCLPSRTVPRSLRPSFSVSFSINRWTVVPRSSTDVLFLDARKRYAGSYFHFMATTAFAPILGFEWIDGVIIASAAMTGDLSSSFLKRRLNLPPSSRATGIDQIPECLLPTVAIRSTLGLTAFDVLSVVIIFFVGEVLLSRLLFKWYIRNRPY